MVVLFVKISLLFSLFQTVINEPDNEWPDNSDEWMYFLNGREVAAFPDSLLVLEEKSAYTSFTKGRIFFEQGSFPDAADQFLQAVALIDTVKNPLGYGQILNWLGLALYYNLEKENALKTQKKAFEVFTAAGNEKGIARTLSYLGHLYEKRSEYNEAISYQNQSLAAYRRSGDSLGVALVYEQLGSIYEDLGRYDTALALFTDAYQLSIAYNAELLKTVLLNNLGDIHRKTGNYTLALDFSRQSLWTARKNGQKYHVRGALRDLAKLHQLKMDWKTAFLYQDSTYTLQTELYNTGLIEKLARQRTLFELEAKNTQIDLLEASRNSQRYRFYTALISFLTVVISASLIVSRQRLNLRKSRQVLEQKEQLIETTARLNNATLEMASLEEAKLRAELEKNALNEKYLAQELEIKQKELAGQVLSVIQKNNLLDELKVGITALVRKSDGENRQALQKLSNLIEYNFNIEKDWEAFRQTFEQVNKTFYDALSIRFPDLTSTELRLCSLIRLNLSSKDMSAMLGISQDSLRISRYRLRKKLNLDQGESLTAFIMSV